MLIVFNLKCNFKSMDLFFFPISFSTTFFYLINCNLTTEIHNRAKRVTESKLSESLRMYHEKTGNNLCGRVLYLARVTLHSIGFCESFISHT